MPLVPVPVRPAPALAALFLGLAACAPRPHSATEALPPGADARTATLAVVKDAMDGADRAQRPLPAASPAVIQTAAPLITGLGFAQIAGQPGKTVNEKRLMAIRAARLEALRDLTEQVHGIRIDAQSTLREAVMRSDRLDAAVTGSLRGARTVYIQPKGSDGYEVKMALDKDTVGYILRAARGGF
mgnify:CR=1 FL=1